MSPSTPHPPPLAVLNVGIVVANEATGHPWQPSRWRPIDVVIGNASRPTGEVLSQTETQTCYFAGSATLELHRKETPAYLTNLEGETPSVYVVLEQVETGQSDIDESAATAAPLPVRLSLVTLSPFEAQNFLDSDEAIVEAVPMPEPLIAWLIRFVDTHHVEEPFIKRKRKNVRIEDEKFGQEPLDVLRRRQADSQPGAPAAATAEFKNRRD